FIGRHAGSQNGRRTVLICAAVRSPREELRMTRGIVFYVGWLVLFGSAILAMLEEGRRLYPPGGSAASGSQALVEESRQSSSGPGAGSSAPRASPTSSRLAQPLLIPPLP